MDSHSPSIITLDDGTNVLAGTLLLPRQVIELFESGKFVMYHHLRLQDVIDCLKYELETKTSSFLKERFEKLLRVLSPNDVKPKNVWKSDRLSKKTEVWPKNNLVFDEGYVLTSPKKSIKEIMFDEIKVCVIGNDDVLVNAFLTVMNGKHLPADYIDNEIITVHKNTKIILSKDDIIESDLIIRILDLDKRENESDEVFEANELIYYGKNGKIRATRQQIVKKIIQSS